LVDRVELALDLVHYSLFVLHGQRDEIFNHGLMLGELALTGLFENLLHEIGDIFWYGEVGIFDSERDF